MLRLESRFVACHTTPHRQHQHIDGEAWFWWQKGL